MYIYRTPQIANGLGGSSGILFKEGFHFSVERNLQLWQAKLAMFDYYAVDVKKLIYIYIVILK